MSRCGCVENPVFGAMRSSLFTSSSPCPVLEGSQWFPKLKLWWESSHEICVWGLVSARRMSITGVSCMHPSMLFGTKLFRRDLGQQLRQGRHLPVGEAAQDPPLRRPVLGDE